MCPVQKAPPHVCGPGPILSSLICSSEESELSKTSVCHIHAFKLSEMLPGAALACLHVHFRGSQIILITKNSSHLNTRGTDGTVQLGREKQLITSMCPSTAVMHAGEATWPSALGLDEKVADAN